MGHSLDGIFGGGNRENNQFRRIFDAGYWRYPIPGKAHVDYWKDINLHHRIIQEVIQIPAGYEAGQRKVEDRLWGKLKWPGPGDFVAYGLARAAEVAALLYYLSRLLRPVREWKAIAAWLDGAKTLPLPSLPQTNMAIWTLGAAWIWKLVWDNPLSVAKQDEMLNPERQLRWERVAMSLWGLVLIYMSVLISTRRRRKGSTMRSAGLWACNDCADLETAHRGSQVAGAIVALREGRCAVLALTVRDTFSRGAHRSPNRDRQGSGEIGRAHV